MGGSTGGILQVGSGPNRLLRAGLGAIAVGMIGIALVRFLLFLYPLGVDLEIPLRAAERWTSGGVPYLASAFGSPPGATQPFLYPPYVLPFAAALVDLPREPLKLIWCAASLAAGLFAVRRLAIPARWWPFVLAWSPFAEGIIGGNVQIVLFAAFVAMFWRQGQSRSGVAEASERDLATGSGSPWRAGLLASLIAALKVTQVLPLVYLVRHRPVAAVVGASALAALVLLTLPLTGLDLWGAWLAQLRLGTDPNWDLAGIGLARFAPPGIGLAVTALTVVATLAIGRRADAPAWIGVLSVWGAPSLHPFGLLFLLPAMLRIRLELALIAAALIATTTYEGSWAGIVLVTAAMLVSLRSSALLESGAQGAGKARMGL